MPKKNDRIRQQVYDILLHADAPMERSKIVLPGITKYEVNTALAELVSTKQVKMNSRLSLEDARYTAIDRNQKYALSKIEYEVLSSLPYEGGTTAFSQVDIAAVTGKGVTYGGKILKALDAKGLITKYKEYREGIRLTVYQRK